MRSSAALVDLLRRRPVTAFLLWFFTVGQLIAFVPVLAAANGVRLAPEPFTIGSTLVGLLLPALVITWVVDGPVAARGLLRRAGTARLSMRWYAVVLGVVPLTSLGVACAMAGPPAGITVAGLGAAYLLGLVLQAVVHLITNNLWEEVAWTGFVHSRLQARHSPMVAAAMTAPLFALQHTALVVGGSLAGTVAVLLVLIMLAFPYRAVMGWLDNRTHSLLLVGATHAAGDAVAAGTVLGEGFLQRLYGQNLGPLHLFSFAAIGLVAIVATRGRLGESTSPQGSRQDTSRFSHRLHRIGTTTRAEPSETPNREERP